MTIIQKSLEKINIDFKAFEQAVSSEACWKLSTTLQETETQLREHIQKKTKAEMMQIVATLKASKDLSPEDLKYVKLWIVGDADYYTKMENNYHDWLAEVGRLMAEIKKITLEDPDIVESSILRAQILDAIRTLGDIMFFLREKERVKNFKESIQEIDPDERSLLIKLLEEKMNSHKF